MFLAEYPNWMAWNQHPQKQTTRLRSATQPTKKIPTRNTLYSITKGYLRCKSHFLYHKSLSHMKIPFYSITNGYLTWKSHFFFYHKRLSQMIYFFFLFFLDPFFSKHLPILPSHWPKSAKNGGRGMNKIKPHGWTNKRGTHTCRGSEDVILTDGSF